MAAFLVCVLSYVQHVWDTRRHVRALVCLSEPLHRTYLLRFPSPTSYFIDSTSTLPAIREMCAQQSY